MSKRSKARAKKRRKRNRESKEVSIASVLLALYPTKVCRVMRRKVREIYNYRCIKCGVKERKCEGLTIHHIIKLADGGSNNLQNLCLMCWACHENWHINHEDKLAFWDWIRGV